MPRFRVPFSHGGISGRFVFQSGDIDPTDRRPVRGNAFDGPSPPCHLQLAFHHARLEIGTHDARGVSRHHFRRVVPDLSPRQARPRSRQPVSGARRGKTCMGREGKNGKWPPLRTAPGPPGLSRLSSVRSGSLGVASGPGIAGSSPATSSPAGASLSCCGATSGSASASTSTSAAASESASSVCGPSVPAVTGAGS